MKIKKEHTIVANLQIKGIEDKFYSKIKKMAASENRSVSQQVLFLIKAYLSKEKQLEKTKSPAQTLLELSGSWNDTRKADAIINEIKKTRINSKKFNKGF
ncbi:MAG: hypothetical protein V1874_10240 [Spirochaetota bacterium]